MVAGVQVVWVRGMVEVLALPVVVALLVERVEVSVVVQEN